MMDLDQLLDPVEAQFLRHLGARGYRQSDVKPILEQIVGQVRARFANSPLSARQLKRRVKDAFVTLLMAHGLHPGANEVANTLHVRGRLNDKEAICLWLGLFYDQSSYCEGLWQMVVDCQTEENVLPLDAPAIIKLVFKDPRGHGDDEISDYCAEQRAAANRALCAADKEPLAEDDILELVAWIVATKLERRDPHSAAKTLNTVAIGVHNSLRRGYHTLLCELLKDVYQTIEN